MARYAFAEPPTAYTRDARESGAGEYALVAQLVADRADHRVLEVEAVPGVELHVFGERQGGSDGSQRACALLLHGGGWSGGDPSYFHPAARYLASRGLVAICVRYRLYQPQGQITVFDCVSDCRAALAWVRAHAAELNVDAHRISAMGDSAGGHLALVLGYPAPAGGAGVDAVVSYNPVADLQPRDAHGPERLAISPCHLVRGAAAPPAPTLLMHGEDDTVCVVDQSRLYAATADERWRQQQAIGDGQPSLPAGFCRYVELPETQHAFCLPNYSAIPSTVGAAMHEAVLFLGRMGHLPLTDVEAARATEAVAWGGGTGCSLAAVAGTAPARL